MRLSKATRNALAEIIDKLDVIASNDLPEQLDNITTYIDSRTEKWKESPVGEITLEQAEELEYAIDELRTVIMRIETYTNKGT